MYTLRGYQRGHYPELYAPNQSTRTLRKRKSGMLSARGDQLDGLFEDEDRLRKRARRSSRRTNPSRKKVVASNDVGTPESSLTPLPTTPMLDDDDDTSLPSRELTPPAPMRTRSSSKSVVREQDSNSLAVPVTSRKRSSSGVSLASVMTANTLVDEDMEDDEGSVASIDTAVEEGEEAKGGRSTLEKLALLVDLATASEPTPSSPLSNLSLSPPPSPRRSNRAIQPTKRSRDMEDDEMVERPRTRLSAASASPAAVKRTRRVKRA